MATDFIEISVKEFYASRHESIDRVRSDLKQKYDDLCAKYTCFTQVVAPPATTSTSHAPRRGNGHASNNYAKTHRIGQHHGGQHHNGGYNHGHNPNRKPRDIHRTIMGIFNVLNKSNYGKLLTKVRLMKTESNIGMIMNGLLDTCVLQIFYLGIYMDFLSNIVENSCEAEKDIIMKTIENCIETFAREKAWLHQDDQANDASYEAFCDHQKARNTIVAKNMMVIELVHLFPDIKCSFTAKSHVDNLRQDLLSALENGQNEHAILALHMLTYIIKTKRVENTFMDMISRVPSNVTNKIRFMIEDLGQL
jgi:hypothetical protein